MSVRKTPYRPWVFDFAYDSISTTVVSVVSAVPRWCRSAGLSVRGEDDAHCAHRDRMLHLREGERGAGLFRGQEARRARQQDEGEPDDQGHFDALPDGRGARDADHPSEEHRSNERDDQGRDEPRRGIPELL